MKPKEEGGLGIQASKAKNIALLAKLNWRMYQDQGAPWARVLLKKYCSILRARSRDPDKLLSSPNWKAIKLGFLIFLKGVCWGVGNGSRIWVWLDSWIKCESLRKMIEGPLNQEDYMLNVEDICGEYRWNWELLSFDLPEIIKDKIKAIPIQNYGHRKDTIMWKHTKDGEFSTNLAYLYLLREKAQARSLRDHGHGSLTFYQRLLPSYGYVCIIASL